MGTGSPTQSNRMANIIWAYGKGTKERRWVGSKQWLFLMANKIIEQNPFSFWGNYIFVLIYFVKGCFKYQRSVKKVLACEDVDNIGSLHQTLTQARDPLTAPHQRRHSTIRVPLLKQIHQPRPTWNPRCYRLFGGGFLLAIRRILVFKILNPQLFDDKGWSIADAHFLITWPCI